jgi:hypothetical protein
MAACRIALRFSGLLSLAISTDETTAVSVWERNRYGNLAFP